MSQENAGSAVALADLCEEAVQRCGADWRRIEAYIAERLRDMAPAERARAESQIAQILRFRAPVPSRPQQH